MTEHPHDYSIPGLFHDIEDLQETVRSALAALPAGQISWFIEQLAEATVAEAQGERDRIGRLLFGVVVDYQLSRNPTYQQALKEVERADELGPPEEIGRKALFTSLRAGR
jgi:hypothetical protein